MSSTQCPPPPVGKTLYDKMSDAIDAAGGNQKCKSTFNNAVSSGMSTASVSAAVHIPFASAGFSANMSSSQNNLREKLTKEGCSDLFMNINQQINSSQAILCQITNSQSTTSVSSSANAAINITQGQPDSQQLALRTAALGLISKPIPPIRPGIGGGTPTSEDYQMYSIALENYNDAMKITEQEINSVMGKVVIDKTNFMNSANVDMRTISNVNAISTTAIATHFKQVAHASAMNTLKNKTGIGSSSTPTKSIVTNRINSKEQSITSAIKNQLHNIKVQSLAESSVDIVFYGALDIKGVTFDQHAGSRIVANNIVTTATNLGAKVALGMLSDAHTSTKSQNVSTGEGAVLQKLLAGQVAMTKANAAGAENMFKTAMSGSGFGMLLLIPVIIIGAILMFFPKVASIIAPGPLKYVLAGILLYLIIAWFMGFWPFSKSKPPPSSPKKKPAS